jgi:hypothetical protein
LQSETYVSLVSGLRNTIALDFYYNHSNNGDNSIIFWTDVIDDKIYKGTLISNCELTLFSAVVLLNSDFLEKLRRLVVWVIFCSCSFLDDVCHKIGKHRRFVKPFDLAKTFYPK